MRDVTKLATVMLLGLGGCDLLGSKEKVVEKQATTTAVASDASRLCGSNTTYTKLKQSAFDEAKRIRERDTEALDKLADASVVRMENPLLESRDDAMGLTVCSGRMILELPPGAGAAFDGKQRLEADVTYSAQAAADGSGTVFKIDGGEPIVYRLANFDTGTRTAAIDAPVEEPMPPADTLEDDEPVTVAPIPSPPPPPAPAPRVAAAATPIERQRLREDALRERQRVAAQRERNRDAAAERTARAERITEVDDRADERRVADLRAERARAAEREAASRRVARAERIAVARRTERGEDEAGPAAGARPSFNCRYARSRVEKMVCGSNDLAARDRRMANLYSRTNDAASAPTKRALSASRLRFLAYRDRCTTETCVAAAYEDRMDEIADMGED